MVEAREASFRGGAALVAGATVADLFRKCAGKHSVASFADVAASVGDLTVTCSDTAQDEDDALTWDLRLYEVVGQQHPRLEVIDRKAGWDDDEIAGASNLFGGRSGMGCAIQDEQVVLISDFQRLLNSTELFNRHIGLDSDFGAGGCAI